MRTFALTIAAALAVGMVTPTLAAKSPTNRQLWAQDQASDPQSFQWCVDLARQRGFSLTQDRGRQSFNGSNGVRKFVEGCMAGRFH
jgi:hypothetical protein